MRKIEIRGKSQYVLVTGAKRRQACINLGIAVECREEKGDELDAELWEVSENLHRGTLSASERADHKARWLALNEKRAKRDLILAAGAAKIKKSAKNPKGAGRSKGGQREAARNSGISRSQFQESSQIAKLPDSIKEAAERAGVDSHKELLKIARTPESKRQQAINELASKKNDKPTNPLIAAWDRASSEIRSEF